MAAQHGNAFHKILLDPDRLPGAAVLHGKSLSKKHQEEEGEEIGKGIQAEADAGGSKGNKPAERRPQQPDSLIAQLA
ncbi:hypothetical protein D3C73_1506420 [compost metagenome]